MSLTVWSSAGGLNGELEFRAKPYLPNSLARVSGFPGARADGLHTFITHLLSFSSVLDAELGIMRELTLGLLGAPTEFFGFWFFF
jgi:hypothetical protein